MTSGTQARSFDPARTEERVVGLCEQLCDAAAKRDVDDAEAYGVYSQTISVRFEKGDLKISQVDEGTSLGLRVFKDHRLGFASTNQTNAHALDMLADDARTLAGFSPPDEHNALPEASELPAGVPLVESELAGRSVEAIVDCAQELVAKTLAVDPRLSLDQASVQLERLTAALHSTRGVHAFESDAHVVLSVFGMAIDGDDVGGFDYWGDLVREAERLPRTVDDVAQRFATAALGNLATQPAESYRGAVLFSPAAFADIFIDPLVSAASAIAVQRGRSALAGRIGEAVSDARLSVIDDPTDATLGGAARFDREGQPAVRFPIVQDGVLQSFLYNAYAARVDGCRSTGHAAGGTRSAPGLGPHAVCAQASGGTSRAELTQQLDRGLVVQRFSGTVDPASGDFSGVAKSARWVEQGAVQHSVRETLISGNAFELLRSVAGFSSEAESILGVSRAPWALIDGLSVTAG